MYFNLIGETPHVHLRTLQRQKSSYLFFTYHSSRHQQKCWFYFIANYDVCTIWQTSTTHGVHYSCCCYCCWCGMIRMNSEGGVILEWRQFHGHILCYLELTQSYLTRTTPNVILFLGAGRSCGWIGGWCMALLLLSANLSAEAFKIEVQKSNQDRD